MLSESFVNFLKANKGGEIGVAVSGGGDSVALLLCALESAANCGVTVRAATVDHELRTASAAEATFVGNLCASRNVAHEVLPWVAGPQGGNLQDEARQARYGLLAEWAKAHRLVGVLIGHTADDQAETFVMRLARGAGADGLAAMPASMTRHGVPFYRPLLEKTRAELRAYLTACGQDWVEDPSNEDNRFERVKTREALETLQKLDIGADTLSEVAAQMRAASSALQALTHRNILQLVTMDLGDVCVDWRAFCGLGHEEARRFVLAILNGVAPAIYPPRRAEQLNLIKAVRAQKTVTLHGCLWSWKDGVIRVTREVEAVRGTSCASNDLWDNRWVFDGPHAADLELRVLDENGLAQCPDWRACGVPRASALALPAVWRGEELVAAPLAGMPNGWCARLTRSREQFLSGLLSH